MRGAGECCIDRRRVAVLPVERYVARRAPRRSRRIRRHRALDVRRRGERIERRLARLRPRPAPDAAVSATTIGDRLADIAHALRRQHRHRGLEHRPAVAAVKDATGGMAPMLVRREILAGDHGDDARHVHRRRGVDRANVGMGDGRAHERGVGLAGTFRSSVNCPRPVSERRVLAADGAMSAAEPKACTVSLLRFVSLRAHVSRSSREYRTLHCQYMQYVLDAHANRGSRPWHRPILFCPEPVLAIETILHRHGHSACRQRT